METEFAGSDKEDMHTDITVSDIDEEYPYFPMVWVVKVSLAWGSESSGEGKLW